MTWAGVVVLVLIGAMCFSLGMIAGKLVPDDQMLVPKKSGSPRDLPAWACNEIVAHRLERWRDTYRPPPRRSNYSFTWHYLDLRVC